MGDIQTVPVTVAVKAETEDGLVDVGTTTIDLPVSGLKYDPEATAFYVALAARVED